MAHNGQRFRGLLVSVCTVFLLVASAWPASAASDDQSPGSSSIQPPPANADFFLGRPRATVGLRGSWVFASAGSDIFDFVTQHLTLEKSSFNTASLGTEFGINVAPRLDLMLGFDASKSTTPSHYREKSEPVGDRFLPIEQTTSLKEAIFSAGFKFALLSPGRRVSRYAWIPSRVAPYVGAGAGVINYDFEQVGDFVDFADDRIFTSTFRSKGWAPSAHLLGGADIHVFRRVFMSIEGRYTFSSAKLDRDFIDFEPIDLKGFRFGAGLHYAF